MQESLKKNNQGFSINSFLLGLVLLFPMAPVAAQNTSTPAGFPPLQFWLPEDYRSMNQAWALAQDKRGWVWAGLNNGTAMVHDGFAWQMAEIKGRNMIRSFWYDSLADRMYTGAVGEFGYFGFDSSQTIRFVSLADKLPEPRPDFADVWRVFPSGEELLFFTRSALFYYHLKNETFRIENDPKTFMLAYQSGNSTFLFRKGDGVFQLKQGLPEKTPLAEDFLQLNLRNIHNLPGNRRLMVSTDRGLEIVDAESGQKIAFPPVDSLNKRLVPERIYVCIPLSENRWAVGTLSNGVYVIDQQWDVRFHFNEAAGLSDVNIWSLMEDRQGGLWYGTNYGIGRAQLAHPIEEFDRRSGLRGIVEKVVSYNNTLYLASHGGLFHWDGRKFVADPIIKSECWDASVIRKADGTDVLLVNAAQDVFEVSPGRTRKVFSGDQIAFRIHGVKEYPGTVLIGRKKGLLVMTFAGDRLVTKFEVPGLEDEIRQIVEMTDGTIWMEANYKGVWRFPRGFFEGGRNIKPVFYNRFGPPDNETFVKIVPVDEQTILRTNAGMYRWDAVSDSMIPWNLPLAPDRRSDEPTEFLVNKKNMWFTGSRGFWQLEGVSLVWKESYFNTLRYFGAKSHINESDSTLILGGNRGLIRIHIRPEYWDWKPREPSILMNRNLLSAESRIPKIWEPQQKLTIPFGDPVFLNVSPGFFGDPRTMSFRTRVEGLDTAWTDYSPVPSRELERLPPGEYTVFAQARNGFLVESAQTSRKLIILPPWYRTPGIQAAGMALAVILFLLIILAVRRYYDRRQSRLETIIEERTTDMRQEKLRADYMNLQLADQAGQLRKVIEERRLLTGMVVHDLKNPIGAVRGYAELISDQQTSPEEIPELATRIVRVTQRMLQSIASLLHQDHLAADLSAEPVSISETTMNLLGEMMILANRKKQTVRSRIEQDCWIAMPAERIAMVIENLLSNAIKYTPLNGEILLEVQRIQRKGDLPLIRLQVTDSGLGLSKEDMAHLFHRYDTGSNKPTGGENATGLGLFAIKQTMEAYGGTIEAFSEGKGKGSRFVATWTAVKEPTYAREAD